ncbi:MAG: preprotein translocase subunit SecA [Gammaproteobacteria bacterium]|nr:preprotein translocase subunit SecA [Gammaproteobacteria bacterium]|tara:strand:+ start:6508 stop:9201 length:2694 start_codon:yes stop_codon:yes gene_type:complete
MSIFTPIFGSKNSRSLKRIDHFVRSINKLENEFTKLEDSELKEKRIEFIQRYKNGETLESLLPESFAIAREVGKRQLNLRHFDCQLIGGIALHNCQIAEMATGEGKTLVATLPCYLNSITERKVVLVTVNDYLAKRDAEWMKPIYEGLGLKVSYVVSGQDLKERMEAYEADVIYATNNELGFDFLRNNMAMSKDERVLNDFYFAIVDEVDSILIDEARTPLVISGAAEDTSKVYGKIAHFLPQLTQQSFSEDEEGNLVVETEGDFSIDEKSRSVELTEGGHDKVEKLLQSSGMLEDQKSLYSSSNLRLLHYIQSSLRANFLFQRDVDYMVQDNQIVLIDENTGRAMPGRRLGDGLHQAIEQKEGVPIQMESQTLASCTFQNYFRQYEKLAGMTGTASTESQEFLEIYNLTVLEIPTNQEMIRKDYNDVVFLTEKEKFEAVIDEIEEFREKGNPVLVGTASLESSETISDILKTKNIEHQVLNAKNHAREAEIIAQAGRPGVVTIATNMAGRGTDIVLGGNWEAKTEKKGSEIDISKEKIYAQWEEDNKKVLSSGGLHVIGTERNESRRIDNQLRGRSGRQGDPGSSRFFISLEDSLMRIFASDQVKNMMQSLGLQDGEAIEHRMLSGAIQRAQKRVEGRNFDIRKVLLEYDDMANEQRQIIYSQRNSVLESADLTELLDSMRRTVIENEVDSFIPLEAPEHQWDIKGLENSINNNFGMEIPIEEWLRDDRTLQNEGISERIFSLASSNYHTKTEVIGGVIKDFEKQILLQVIDNAWKDHLGSVEYLRQGIGLRGYGSRNPKLEFRKESFELFENLLGDIRYEATRFLARVQIEVDDKQELEDIKKSKTKETYEHQSSQSAFTQSESNEEPSQVNENQGNRRLRRYEAKMARKKGNKE